MSYIKDEDGEEMVFWPVEGLVEGETSSPITIKVDCPLPSGELKGSSDSRLIIWARQKALGGPYQNISDTGIDLSALVGEVEFEVYVEATAGISGVERVPFVVMASTSEPAPWTN